MNLPCTQLADVCDLQCRRGILSFGLIQYLIQYHIVLSFLNQVLHYRKPRKYFRGWSSCKSIQRKWGWYQKKNN